ncbi:hypothetical protein BDV10DRAFT_154807 [Aspergillus recurvatus]
MKVSQTVSQTKQFSPRHSASPFGQLGVAYNGIDAHITVQPPEQAATKYIPAGDTAMDLPSIGNVLSDPFPENDILSPFYGLLYGQGQERQGALGEYLIALRAGRIGRV